MMKQLDITEKLLMLSLPLLVLVGFLVPDWIQFFFVYGCARHTPRFLEMVFLNHDKVFFFFAYAINIFGKLMHFEMRKHICI